MTCRDLKLQKKLLDIQRTKQSDPSGKYNVCTAKIKIKGKPVNIKMPTRVANWTSDLRKVLTDPLKKGQTPVMRVTEVTGKKGFRGSYDWVSIEWS